MDSLQRFLARSVVSGVCVVDSSSHMTRGFKVFNLPLILLSEQCMLIN